MKTPTPKGYGHHEVYEEPAFSEVARAWYRERLPAKSA
jgi:hypothetical protein